MTEEQLLADRPLAEVLGACDAALEKMTPGPWAHEQDWSELILSPGPGRKIVAKLPTASGHDNAEGIVTLVNAYPRLRAELERLQRANTLIGGERDELLQQRTGLRADLERKEAALRMLFDAQYPDGMHRVSCPGESEDQCDCGFLAFRTALGENNG